MRGVIVFLMAVPSMVMLIVAGVVMPGVIVLSMAVLIVVMLGMIVPRMFLMLAVFVGVWRGQNRSFLIEKGGAS